MKQPIVFFLLTIIGLTLLAGVGGVNAASVDLTGPVTTVGGAAGFNNQQPNLATTLGLIIRVVLSILGVVFLAYTIYGGYLWMMARGNEETVVKAKAVMPGRVMVVS